MTQDKPLIGTTLKQEHSHKRYVSPYGLRMLAETIEPEPLADVLRVAADTIEELRHALQYVVDETRELHTATEQGYEILRKTDSWNLR